MSVPTSNISFRAISNVFGGTDPISLSEYYANANPSYTSGVSGIPNIGSAISLSQFSGKSKPVTAVNYMLAGNAAANMNTAGGGQLGFSNTDDSFSGIGTVGQFFWFGNDWGSSNNVQWCTNAVLTFGGGSTQYTPWGPGTGRGVLIGQADRMIQTSYPAHQFNPYTSNNHSIKRLIVTQMDYDYRWVIVQYEIRLIRGPAYQYIEIRIGGYNSPIGGIWNISDGGSFYNVFSGAPPVGANGSVVLRGDLNGYNWQAFNGHYINL
jgi:hypothetical protein